MLLLRKKKTRADKAKELGLMELLDEIFMKAQSEEEALSFAKKYIKEGIDDEADAINKSLDILAEDVANNIEAKNIIRRDGLVRARILAEKRKMKI